jgi:parvulin-like peptidyl-prolyl isomerase
MHLIARVFDIDITEADVTQESGHLIGKSSDLALTHALNRLIDRCLLFHQALSCGFSASEEEYDSALLESLEEADGEPLDPDQAQRMEERIRRRIIIRKYVKSICAKDILIADDQLMAFYEDQKEVFFAPEVVRASHILIRKDAPDAEARAREIRARIKTPDDFYHFCNEHSQCPSGCRSGDLGYFPRDRMIREIDEVAFALGVNEISDVFASRHGYHILMVTDRKAKEPVPFSQIKDSLRARLIQLEREYFLIRHLNELRRQFESEILILDKDFSS